MDFSLEKRYPVAADVERAWQVLSDVHAVARCMPGAELTEQVDATHFKGAVKVKVGPAVAQFGGELEVLALDAAAHSLRLRGKGSDKGGGSTATLELTAQLQPGAGQDSTLVGTAQVVINGKLVQMAGRMLAPVSETILAQFAQNFSAAAAAIPLPAAPEAPAVPEPPAAPPPAPARELNALALAWTMLRNWFASLLGRRT